MFLGDFPFAPPNKMDQTILHAFYILVCIHAQPPMPESPTTAQPPNCPERGACESKENFLEVCLGPCITCVICVVKLVRLANLAEVVGVVGGTELL